MLLWLMVAWPTAMAQAPAGPAPVVRREARRPYPRPLYDDWSEPHACTVTATLDAKGRPRDVRPVDCEGPLGEWTVRRVRRDRWERPAQAGVQVDVTVNYVPPVLAMEFPEPGYWRRREVGSCHVHLAVSADGAAVVRRGDEACLPSRTVANPTPGAMLRGRTPSVCSVTFVLAEGGVTGLDLFRCTPRTWSHVRHLIGASSFPWPGQDMPYTVILQFDRPSEASASSPP